MTVDRGIPAVLSVGRLYCDLIFADLPRLPSLGTEVFAQTFGAHAGGGAFITAAHLSALGHSVSLATMLPSSPFSDLVRSEIEASNVDLSLSGTLPENDGPQLTVAITQGDERAFLTRRTGPPFPDISMQNLNKRQIRHLHIGELKTLVEKPEVIPLARSLGLTVSLDCGWDDGLTASEIRPVLGKVDVFLPNEAELERLRELGVTDCVPKLTVTKRGAKGSSAMFDGKSVLAPVAPMPAVDTTGAGDAFNAGFISAWLAGETIQSCLEAGNDRGALAIRKLGGFRPDVTAPTDLGLS